MTQAQKSILNFWLLLLATITVIILIEFSSIGNKQLLSIITFTPVLIIASINQDFNYYQGYGKNNKNLGKYLKNKPIIKTWLIIYCMLILPVFIYKIMTDDSIDTLLYYLSFALLIGPIFIASERERFLDAANKKT